MQPNLSNGKLYDFCYAYLGILCCDAHIASCLVPINFHAVVAVLINCLPEIALWLDGLTRIVKLLISRIFVRLVNFFPVSLLLQQKNLTIKIVHILLSESTEIGR